MLSYSLYFAASHFLGRNGEKMPELWGNSLPVCFAGGNRRVGGNIFPFISRGVGEKDLHNIPLTAFSGGGRTKIIPKN